MYNLKNMRPWAFQPGKKLAKVTIEGRASGPTFAGCTRIVSQAGLSVLSGFMSAPDQSGLTAINLVLDATEPGDKLAHLKHDLEALQGVDQVTITTDDSFSVDKGRFPVHAGGRKAIILQADAVSEMLSRLRSVFGTGALTIVDQMAEAMGRQSAKMMVEDLGGDFATSHVDDLLRTYTALGYADMSVERRRPDEFPVVAHASGLFECEANVRRRNRQRSVFFKAHVRGFISEIFKSEFEVSEAQCITEGDEICSFRIEACETPVSPSASRPSNRRSRSGPLPTF